jgi:hypothetical protein
MRCVAGGTDCLQAAGRRPGDQGRAGAGQRAWVTEEMGLMRTKTVWRAWLLGALAVLAPGRAFASDEDYAPPANIDLPLPLYSTNPARGGFFCSVGYAQYNMTNPIRDQPIAYRGFIVSEQTVPVAGTFGPILLGLGVSQGSFFGDRTIALNASQVSGPTEWAPGFTVDAGWKFEDGTALTIGYLWLSQTQYRADATSINRPGQNVGDDQAGSFLTAFVFNFPSGFNGANAKIVVRNPQVPAIPPELPLPGAVAGVWNGATEMDISFVQRITQIDATYRIPYYETECYRLSGLIGPRFFWIWEKFRWRTQDTGLENIGGVLTTLPDDPTFNAIYNNIVSNRMYGVFAGCSQEWYVGHGLAAQVDIQVAAYCDIVKERANYQTGVKDGTPQNKRNATEYRFVPQLRGTPYLMWYPWEGIQIKVGYDFFCFFNTLAAPQPIDFNYSQLDPGYRSIFRQFNGFDASIAISF